MYRIKMYTIRQEFTPHLGQQQRQQLSFSMQQAIQVLQMPIVELSDWLKGEIEENPCLEYSQEEQHREKSHKKEEKNSVYYEREVAAYPSLFDHLMQQARFCFLSKEELSVAEWLIGNLDSRGFLTETKIGESMYPVLKKLQSFDPPGIGAVSLQESLLIQLRLKGKQGSLAYRIVEHHFEDLLHNRQQILSKKLRCSTLLLRQTINGEIARLNLRPAAPFFHEPTATVIADVVLKHEEESWTIELNETLLPLFDINPIEGCDRYYIQRARWLRHAVASRNKTLLKICKYLVKRHGDFLSGVSEHLEPMTLQDVAAELNFHISTIGRAISQKYLVCPRGTLLIRSLFCHDLGNATSNQSAKQLLLGLIEKENKEHPLSDEALSLKISALGIPLARRTVTKYRKQHKIPAATFRRHW